MAAQGPIPDVRPISRDELRAKIDRGDAFLLVETLTPEHFRHAHLPGAVNIPPERIGELTPQLLPDKQTEVVLYCANVKCHLSENIAHQLTALGYTSMRFYPGGKHDWVTAGLPIERGELVSQH